VRKYNNEERRWRSKFHYEDIYIAVTLCMLRRTWPVTSLCRHGKGLQNVIWKT